MGLGLGTEHDTSSQEFLDARGLGVWASQEWRGVRVKAAENTQQEQPGTEGWQVLQEEVKTSELY